MPLTPSKQDPQYEAELDRRRRNPADFGVDERRTREKLMEMEQQSAADKHAKDEAERKASEAATRADQEQAAREELERQIAAMQAGGGTDDDVESKGTEESPQE